MTKINPPDDRIVAIASWPIVQLCRYGWCHSNLNKLQLEEYARVFDEFHSATDSEKDHTVGMTRGALQGVLKHLLACRLDAASNVVVWQRALADAILDDDNLYIAEVLTRASDLADREGMGHSCTIDACAEVEKVLKHQNLIAKKTKEYQAKIEAKWAAVSNPGPLIPGQGELKVVYEDTRKLHDVVATLAWLFDCQGIRPELIDALALAKATVSMINELKTTITAITKDTK